MRKAIGCLLLLTACSSPKPAPEPQTAPIVIAARGLSCDSAIAMTAMTESQGIAEEHQYVRENYPGAHWDSQDLSSCNGKSADVIHITTANAQKFTLYFDISNWFGKH